MLGEELSGGRNAGLVRRLYAAFAARDADALLDVVAQEIEFFGPTATVLNEGRCYRGHEGMRRYLRDAEALWETLEIDPQKLREVGNHVVALGRVRARARDGMELDTPAAWVWRIEGGLITWGCAYGDPDGMPRALQEGGRSEAGIEASRLRAGALHADTREPLP
jgi:ketosteroid isomerase-like protein